MYRKYFTLGSSIYLPRFILIIHIWEAFYPDIIYISEAFYSDVIYISEEFYSDVIYISKAFYPDVIYISKAFYSGSGGWVYHLCIYLFMGWSSIAW